MIKGQTDIEKRFVSVAGGSAKLGTDAPELTSDGEGPKRHLSLKPYRIDPFAVTNRWFTEFIAATDYETDAQKYGWSLVFKDLVPEQERSTQVVADTPWWCKIYGADWAHPFGPSSSITGIEEHPATHISWNDAVAFARWAQCRLPNELEWEHAARGGLHSARFPWGEEEPDDTTVHCNIWQGNFPDDNTLLDGYLGTAPVDSFAANGYGLHNTCGNVWEWCSDLFTLPGHSKQIKRSNRASIKAQRHLLKGGSYLCHRSYCYRYRIAARTGVQADTSAGHTGFRVVAL